MKLLKVAILGAAAVYGFKYVTRKRSIDGKSLVDDLKDRVLQCIEEANDFGDRVKHDYRQTSDLY